MLRENPAEWVSSLASEHNPNDVARARVTAAVQYVLMENLIGLGTQQSSAAGDFAEAAAVLYYATCRAVREADRLKMLRDIEALAISRQITPMPLYTFLSAEASVSVVSSAALAMAQVLAMEDEPVLGGVKFIASRAKSYAEEGTVAEDIRAAAVLTGLVLLGDRRVTDVLGPCWRWLSTDGRRELSRLSTIWVYAAVVDWLVDWLEDCEGDEFGAVAGTLARFGAQAHEKGVLEIRRTFPAGAAPEGQVVNVCNRWTASEYAERLLPRLQQLAALESGPRVYAAGVVLLGNPHLNGPMQSEVEARSNERMQQSRSLGVPFSAWKMCRFGLSVARLDGRAADAQRVIRPNNPCRVHIVPQKTVET